MKNMKRLTVLVVTVLIMGLTIAGCSCSTSSTNNNTTNATSQEATVSKEYTLKITDKDGQVKEYKDSTTSDKLIGVMDELVKKGDFTYEMGDGANSSMVMVVNGQRADFNQDKAYWAIYVNGNYGNYGVNDQTVQNGDTFEFRYEKSQQ